jgi:hypothetical protein
MNLPTPRPLSSLQAWELNVLGIYDFVSSTPTIGLEAWFQFLRDSSHLEGDICEFGVFRGRSLIGAAAMLAANDDPRRVIGFDTFTGFPKLSDEDMPERFDEMADRGQISLNHLHQVQRNAELLRAIGRSINPLRSSSSGVFDSTSRELIESRAAILGVSDRIKLFEGDFTESLRSPENDARVVSGVLIDSDLHDGYAAVLPWAWQRLVPGGMIYLDEYYSLKFPGPRIAVDSFCADHSIRPTLLRRDGVFERWAILK